MTDKKKETYSYEAHKFVTSKLLSKQYCVHCGLLRTNNEFTEWAIRMGCNNTLHPSYQSKLKLTNPFKEKI